MCRNQGTTVIIVTHNSALAPIADRVIRMRNAQVSSIDINPTPKKIENIE